MQQGVGGVNTGIRSLASLYDGVFIAERMHRRVEYQSTTTYVS